MLYVTTRSNQETYTAYHALTENRAPDGGFYVPLKMPLLDQAQIESLTKRPFNQCVAEIMNLLFGCNLTAFDLDFSIGRSPVRITALNHRILIGECWHNLSWDYEQMVKTLYRKVVTDAQTEPSDWFRIGLRIAVLFGFWGKLMRREIAGVKTPVDLAVLSGDFSVPMAVWYARSMGLPIGNIVCCCNENSSVWELFHHGEFRTGTIAIKTELPAADVAVPVSLERLIHGCGGYAVSCKYVDVLRKGGIYRPNDVILGRLKYGMDVSVVSSKRTQSAIVNVYRSQGYMMNPYTAMQYTGLQDYRSRTGETGMALVLAERSPAKNLQLLSRATDIPEEEIMKRL